MTTLLWDGSSALYTLGGALVEAPGDCCCLPPSSSSGSSSGSSGSGSGSGSGTSGSGTSGYPCEVDGDCEYWFVDIIRSTSPCYLCSGDECLPISCPETTCLEEDGCYTDEFACNAACGPTGQETECDGTLGPFTSYEEANQAVSQITEPCTGTIIVAPGYCCNGQCSPTPCEENPTFECYGCIDGECQGFSIPGQECEILGYYGTLIDCQNNCNS